MRSKLSRRDFLKLAGLLSGSAALPSFVRVMPAGQAASAGRQNVLIVVFDAFSAYHLAMHGYGRETAPNLTHLAERGIVYHNHFAAGNFTTPGTASLFTGVYPWTHRAFQMHQPVADSFASQNIFSAFAEYLRIAYSHNPLVTTLFDQFQNDVDDHIPIEKLLLTDDGLVQHLFQNDRATSGLSWERAIKKSLNGGYSYSLLLADLYKTDRAGEIADFRESFPRGLPLIRGDNYFVLEQAIDFFGVKLSQTPRPFLAYLHFIPPHDPYNTRRDFVDRFKGDSLRTPDKPSDAYFAGGARMTPEFLSKLRRQYDEYILYLDSEFSRFFRQLETSGVLEDTWLILTSDHGELFERGIWEHTTPVLYQPVIRVPLMIFEPGRKHRTDIYAPTSAVDLLPTLLHLTGGQPPSWSEGLVLPPFSNNDVTSSRSIFAVEAKFNDPRAALERATIMLVKGRHKLTSYFGYDELRGEERLELYDLESDPQELQNLYASQPDLGSIMLEELKAKLADMNRAYL